MQLLIARLLVCPDYITDRLLLVQAGLMKIHAESERPIVVVSPSRSAVQIGLT